MRWLDGIIYLMDMSLNKLWEGQGSLVCCSPWGRKELDTTEELKSNIKMTQIELLNIKTVMD